MGSSVTTRREASAVVGGGLVSEVPHSSTVGKTCAMVRVVAACGRQGAPAVASGDVVATPLCVAPHGGQRRDHCYTTVVALTSYSRQCLPSHLGRENKIP